MAKTKLYQANQGFSAVLDDENLFVQPGELVSAGHPLLKGHDHFFEPAPNVGRFDESGEEKPAAPDEKATPSPKRVAKKKAPAKKAPAKASAAKSEAPVAESPSSGHFGLRTTDIEPKRG